MQVSRLVAHLEELMQHGLSPEAVVNVWCPDAGGMQPIQSMLFDAAGKEVKLSSFDEGDEEYT